MAKPRLTWSEIVFGGGSESSRVSRGVTRGELRKIGPALYTSNHTDPPARVVGRHLWETAAHYAPGAGVPHRTAFEGRPSQDGTVFMTSSGGKRLDLPGLRLRVQKGPGSLPGDRPFVNGLVLASEPRLLLENLGLARERSGARRTVSRQDVELRPETSLRRRGEAALNDIPEMDQNVPPTIIVNGYKIAAAKAVELLLRSRPAK